MRIHFSFLSGLFLLLSITALAQSDSTEIKKIMARAESFSAAYMALDYDKMTSIYSEDASILPPGADIINGREAIRKRWILPEGVKILEHSSTTTEIKLLGDWAYDVGYYQGRSIKPEAEAIDWKGKYLIIWKKEAGEWMMYLDIWNRMKEE